MCSLVQLHLHRVVVTDGKGLQGQHVASGWGSLSPATLPACPYLLLRELEALGEVEGRSSTHQPLAGHTMQHDAVIGAVGAGAHSGVLAISNGPAEAHLGAQQQCVQALLGQRGTVGIEIPQQNDVLGHRGVGLASWLMAPHSPTPMPAVKPNLALPAAGNIQEYGMEGIQLILHVLRGGVQWDQRHTGKDCKTQEPGLPPTAGCTCLPLPLLPHQSQPDSTTVVPSYFY